MGTIGSFPLGKWKVNDGQSVLTGCLLLNSKTVGNIIIGKIWGF